MEALFAIFSAFGLSASAGLNAYIPLLVVGVVAHYTDLIELAPPFDTLANPYILILLGILALLTIIFSIVWITIMRQDNTFVSCRQLWLPAAAGLTLAFVMIIGIDLIRLNLTHTWGGFPGLKG